jgi:hypothetical protein
MLFEPLENLSTPLWRYVGLAKFIATLHTRSLVMVPAALMDDKFEGSFPSANNPYQRVKRALSGADRSPTPEQMKLLENDLLAIGRNARKGVLLSCWHASETESVAMWKLYASDAICIMSDYGSLCRVLGAPTEATDDCPQGQYRVGRVTYLNYRKESIDNQHWLAPFLHKRAEFAHEREVRALYVEHEPPQVATARAVPIALRDLIHGVVVAPGSQRWYVDSIADLLGKYDLDVPINISALDGTPIP